MPLLLEDDPAAEVSIRVIRVALQHAGQQLQGFVEVARGRLAPAFLACSALTPLSFRSAIARLIAPGIQPGARWRTSRKASTAALVLVLLHVAQALEVSRHDRLKLAGWDLVLERLARRHWNRRCWRPRDSPELRQARDSLARQAEIGQKPGRRDDGRSPSAERFAVASSCSLNDGSNPDEINPRIWLRREQ